MTYYCENDFKRMERRNKTGLMFGSFNPVHKGHLEIAKYFKHNSDLKEVWFVISPQNPLKPKKELLDASHRLALLKMAIQHHPDLKISEVEFSMPEPSYTIDTLNLLAKRYPERNFVVIAGTDILDELHRWKDYNQMLENFGFYIYNRPGYQIALAYRNHPNIRFFDAPLMEISSSSIRQAIRQRKDVGDLIPESVWAVIKENRFYYDE